VALPAYRDRSNDVGDYGGWGKNESRGVFQAFNLTVLSIALLSHAFGGLLTAEVGWALLAVLHGAIIGAWLGAHA
jgi:uncharacterized protein